MPSKPGRVWARAMIGVLVLVVAITTHLACSGCVATVAAPAEPAEPTTVWLALEGIDHTGLVLPRAPGEWVEYAYGDYKWYVEGKHNRCYGAWAFLVPTTAALGRRPIHGDPRQDARYRSRDVELVPLRVEARAAEELLAELDLQFASSERDEVYVPWNGLTFVEAQRAYTMNYTCADATAEWVEALGCRVRGPPIRFELKPAE